MGQVESQVTAAEETDSRHHSSSKDQPPASLESLIAEASAYGDDGNESLDARAQKALECPCIADLRKGPCGTQFSEAFVCFLKSTAEEKGSDCVRPFVALQDCIKSNPGAFSKDILGEAVAEEVKKDEELSQPYRIIPPLWSREQSPKPRL